jgi:eukaryotic-like serine/threonine-protein kinase
MDVSPVAPGQILAGKYRIERVLGEGGMGVVVEALDTGLERRVAIKFLLPDFVKHAEAKERFIREARAAVKIQSEHVARVIDVSTLETGAPYMVMEYLEGSDLSRVIETSGPMTVEDATLYVIQACEALAEAHAHGIVHRDLKPANLFLAQQAGGSRKIKVLDFGISKTLSLDTKAASLTRTSSMMGSPLYMSPEQMKSSRDVDHRTDIWALGVILYETLTGEPPFMGNSIPEISAKILLEDPKPLSEVRATVPKALSDLTMRALQKQPDKRFANVSELALALLPFAPTRARGNAERISRVLEAAGMTKSDFLASVPPPLSSPELAAAPSLGGMEPVQPRSGGPSENPGRRKQTLANWGQTHSDGIPGVTRSNSRLLIGAAAGSLAGIALLVTLVLKFTGSPAEPARATALQPPASATAAPPPPPSEPAEPQLAEPAAPEPKVAVALEAEPALAEHENSAPKAPSSAPTRAKVAKASSASKKPAVMHRATAVAKPTEKPHSVDFKSKFGSRK